MVFTFIAGMYSAYSCILAEMGFFTFVQLYSFLLIFQAEPGLLYILKLMDSGHGINVLCLISSANYFLRKIKIFGTEYRLSKR
jgi:hypothetical protein